MTPPLETSSILERAIRLEERASTAVADFEEHTKQLNRTFTKYTEAARVANRRLRLAQMADVAVWAVAWIVVVAAVAGRTSIGPFLEVLLAAVLARSVTRYVVPLGFSASTRIDESDQPQVSKP